MHNDWYTPPPPCLEKNNIIKKPNKHPIAVPSGPIASRLTIEVEVVGVRTSQEGLFRIDRPKAQEHELAKFDANRHHKKLKSGNDKLNPMRDKYEGKYRGEEGKTLTTACLVQKVAEGKNNKSYKLSWRVKVTMKKRKNKKAANKRRTGARG